MRSRKTSDDRSNFWRQQGVACAKTKTSIVLIAVAIVAACGEGAPKLLLPPGGVEAGDVVAGEAAKAELKLGNAGDSELKVFRVKACCGAEAKLEPMTLPPGGEGTLTVTFTINAPGEFSKSVHLYSNDPERPAAAIPVTGTGIESAAGRGAWRATATAVAAAGIADGINPCTFAVMTTLAGILALGGRKRRARMIGGMAFCLGSFVTYMLLGLGLMQAVRALETFRTAYGIFQTMLAAALFVLSFLSFRDALRFRRVPAFSVFTLRMPESAKNMIRRIAIESWSGRSVFAAGLGCGVLATLPDALCTGQIYVPVVALISREPGAWRSFALLTVYNLSFILPQVVLFAAASKTTEAIQLAKWSTKNAVPAKAGLGAAFALLGVLLLLQQWR